MKRSRSEKQIKTTACTSSAIMRHPNFARGLDDIRAGLPFDADIHDKYWAYERGRMFGAIAPLAMALFQGASLNPKALKLFDAAFDLRLIR